MTGSVPLDLAASPRDNLYAFGKTWGTFGEDPLVSTFHGAMYASVGTSRLQPLFGYAGTGITKVRFVGDGADERLQMRGKETGFFYDLRTGAVIETWDNPFTGETVEVFEGGVMTGRLHSRKTIRGLDDVPPEIRAYTEKHHPEYFEAPQDWDVPGPILSSWEAYARATPREA